MLNALPSAMMVSATVRPAPLVVSPLTKLRSILSMSTGSSARRLSEE